MTTKTKPTAKQYASAAAKAIGPRLIGIGITFSMYLLFTWVLTVGLRHSVGVGVPWFPLAVVLQVGSGMLKMLVEHISSAVGKGAASGKHEAELAQMKATVAAALAHPDALASLFGKGGKSEAAPSFGNYL